MRFFATVSVVALVLPALAAPAADVSSARRDVKARRSTSVYTRDVDFASALRRTYGIPPGIAVANAQSAQTFASEEATLANEEQVLQQEISEVEQIIEEEGGAAEAGGEGAEPAAGAEPAGEEPAGEEPTGEEPAGEEPAGDSGEAEAEPAAEGVEGAESAPEEGAPSDETEPAAEGETVKARRSQQLNDIASTIAAAQPASYTATIVEVFL
ncbi:unnamed protein product [Peniophora sp. CBMAI 1063]|nr:unnamed protein product [Peniophora sp. CBMAI 1063]